MREYVITFVCVALACGLIQMLVPQGDGGGIKKYMSLVCGLCVLCVTISPISRIVSDMSSLGEELFDGISTPYPDKDDYSQIYDDSLIEAGEVNMSSGLKALISRDLGVDESDIDVSVKLREGEDKYLPEKVTVFLYGKAVLCDPHKVIEYVNALLGCECQVIYQ